MADNKKYYYLKLKDDFFDTDAMIVLESMEDGYLYSNILLKLYLRSLKSEGKLLFNNRIPYNPTILAQVTRHSVDVVKKALTVFQELGLIDILDNGAIYMLDIQSFIGKSTTEADRKRTYRNTILAEKGQMSGQTSDKRPPEIDIEKETDIDTELEKELDKDIDTELDKDIDKDKEIDTRVDYQQIVNMFNSTCVSLPRVKSLSSSRKKAIKAGLHTYTIKELGEVFAKAEASSFLKGENQRNWSANFDWLIKDSNIAKVLDGNYDNKKEHYGYEAYIAKHKVEDIASSYDLSFINRV